MVRFILLVLALCCVCVGVAPFLDKMIQAAVKQIKYLIFFEKMGRAKHKRARQTKNIIGQIKNAVDKILREDSGRPVLQVVPDLRNGTLVLVHKVEWKSRVVAEVKVNLANTQEPIVLKGFTGKTTVYGTNKDEIKSLIAQIECLIELVR